MVKGKQVDNVVLMGDGKRGESRLELFSALYRIVIYCSPAR